MSPPRNEPSRLAVIAAFGAIYVIWGSTYLAIRFALETMPPFLMAGLRHTAAGVVLYAMVRYGVVLTKAPRPTNIQWRSAAIIGGLLLLMGNGGVCWAEQTVPSGLAALFVTTVPIWLVLMSWLRRDGARPGIADALGVAMGFGGVLLLLAGNGLLGGERVNPAGAMVLVMASLAWAGGSIYSRHAPLPTSPLMATAMQMLCGGVLLVGVGLASGEGSRLAISNVSMRSVLALLYLTVFGSLVAFSAYVWLLRVTTPSRVGTYAFVNPMVAVLLGYAFGGEALTARTLLATIVIVTAVVLITVYGRRGPRPGSTAKGSVKPTGEERLIAEKTAVVGETDDTVFSIEQLTRAHALSNRPYYEFLRRESMSAGLYAIPAGGVDRQQPHLEDEVYVVLEGRAGFRIDGRARPVGPGSVLYVSAGTDHRFENVAEPLRVLVLFAPAENTVETREPNLARCEHA